MKKNTHWITVPEETIHTPVSGKGEPKSKKESKTVKNKLFWGAGFIIMVVIAFAALAPSQFSALLRGSLFDDSGLLPPEAGETMTFEEEAETAETPDDAATEGEDDDPRTDEGTEEQPTAVVPETIIEPEEEAVTISIEPIGPLDCGEDAECFYTALEDCSLALGKISLEEDTEFDAEITGDEEENCLVHFLATQNPEPDLVDKEMECKIPKETYDQTSFVDYMEDNQLTQCTGSFIDTMNELKEEKEKKEAEEALKKEKEETQAKLIEELARQVEELQKEKELLPSAPEDIPPSVSTTTMLGQPPAVQPGFRVNTHVALVTPEEALRRNMELGSQVAQPTQPTYQPAYQVPVEATPETGPSEILFIAFIITFLSMIGWRFIRTFV